MAKLKDLVDEEQAAYAAEHEGELPPEPDPDDPDAPGPEPEPEPEPELLSMEAALAEFEAENTRHEHELRTIMGDDFDSFRACLVCQGVGFEPGPQLTQDAALTTCDACNGEGQHTTGSRRAGYELRDCTACQGQGFVVKVDVPQTTPAPEYQQPRFDPYTGNRLPEPVEGNGATQPAGTWAPGYVPSAGPAV